jgi:hypothetical protein
MQKIAYVLLFNTYFLFIPKTPSNPQMGFSLFFSLDFNFFLYIWDLRLIWPFQLFGTLSPKFNFFMLPSLKSDE